MRNWIAFGAPFFAALAGVVTTKVPESGNAWLVALIVATAAGFGGLAGKGVNSKMGGKK